ncbi:oxygen-insensitive NADPH nitroreductase [Eikenella sp. S3360]|uniref:Oxygen-insensitive NADPH nitroreductase n=1 Tax=Eikenella glucosivorans TaxID=2766967 RepID=A0ABS0N875_9NEIS|nr:oxygen-insensitive NADPH nitroreductase [Eikenella glucosivorans]MBH5328498.1 oxygen-insensitive NADPH nitroreductase [Eikenella glucosivorans]
MPAPILPSQPTLATALAHRSIRKFTGEPVAPEQLQAILEAGRAASSSSFMQCIHIIRVTDPALRQRLCHIAADQEYVRIAPEFLVFCIDYSKHRRLVPDIQTDYTEALLLGAVDAGITAQNVLLAAESLGLGGVYIGSLRNDIAAAAEALGLPDTAVPLFGMCLGHPAQQPLYRPRLPLEAIVSENRYRECSPNTLEAYDRELAAYYQARSGLDLDWTRQIANTLAKPLRPHILPFLQQRGFARK